MSKTDPYSTKWTEKELETLPSTAMVFSAPKLTADEHKWVQDGYTIVDACEPRTMNCLSTALGIGHGRLLIVDDNGKYQIVDEMRPSLEDKRASKSLQKAEHDKAEALANKKK